MAKELGGVGLMVLMGHRGTFQGRGAFWISSSSSCGLLMALERKLVLVEDSRGLDTPRYMLPRGQSQPRSTLKLQVRVYIMDGGSDSTQ